MSISGGADARPAAAKKKRPRTKSKGGKANNSGGQKKVKESGNESDLSADSSESGDSAESRNFDGGDVGSSDDEAAPAAASGSGRSAADPISLLGPFEKAEIPPLPKVPDGSADEDIKSVLPPFDVSNHSGSRVNMTAGVAGTPLIKTLSINGGADARPAVAGKKVAENEDQGTQGEQSWRPEESKGVRQRVGLICGQ